MANGLNSEEMRIMTLPTLLRSCDVTAHCALKGNPLPHSGNITQMQFVPRDDDEDDEFVAVAVSYGNGGGCRRAPAASMARITIDMNRLVRVWREFHRSAETAEGKGHGADSAQWKSDYCIVGDPPFFDP